MTVISLYKNEDNRHNKFNNPTYDLKGYKQSAVSSSAEVFGLLEPTVYSVAEVQ